MEGEGKEINYILENVWWKHLSAVVVWRTRQTSAVGLTLWWSSQHLCLLRSPEHEIKLCGPQLHGCSESHSSPTAWLPRSPLSLRPSEQSLRSYCQRNQWVELVKVLRSGRSSILNWIEGCGADTTMAEGESEIPCQDYQSWLAEPDESCKDFMMQQTMMRIKDPKASLDFYTRILGMRYG